MCVCKLLDFGQKTGCRHISCHRQPQCILTVVELQACVWHGVCRVCVRVCLCVYVLARAFARIVMRMYIRFMFVCIYICLYSYVCVRVRMLMCTYVYIYVYIYALVCAHMCVWVCMRACVRVGVCLHTHANVCIQYHVADKTPWITNNICNPCILVILTIRFHQKLFSQPENSNQIDLLKRALANETK